MMQLGWKPKALKLRTIVLVGHALAKELSPTQRRAVEINREFRRLYAIGEAQFTVENRAAFDALAAELKALPNDPLTVATEPMKIQGWMLRAGMYLCDGQHWWIVSASRKSPTFSDRDRKVLADTIDLLGGHIDYSALSILPLADVIADRIPFTWTWINQHDLLDLHVRNRGAQTRAADMRIVGADIAPKTGFEKIAIGDSED